LGWRAIGAICASLAVAACATAPPTRQGPPAPVRRPSPSPFPAEPGPPPPLERTRPLTSLHGWEADDHAAALTAFRETCGVSKDPAMAAVCRSARAIGPLDAETAERFFEANFRVEALGGEGVLTAYFAPEYPARHRKDDEFSAPVRPRPADLETVDAGLFDPTQAGRPGAARDRGDGTLEPYPDRAAIEAAPPDNPPFGRPLAWMRPEDLFFLQVQGSGVLTFEGGQRMKVLYAANNGRAFVGLANLMRDRGLLAADDTSAESIRSWLAAHRGPMANEIMRLNPRYAFFSLAPDDGRAPVGAAGVPLPPGRSLAVDQGYHAMGDLFWIDGEAPILKGAFPAYRRLAMALDTGGAIKGDIRADLYIGQGAAAGAEAGRVRHTLRLYRLVPRPAP
jgi:membrane-bound lytic murein transglycosylase A